MVIVPRRRSLITSDGLFFIPLFLSSFRSLSFCLFSILSLLYAQLTVYVRKPANFTAELWKTKRKKRNFSPSRIMLRCVNGPIGFPISAGTSRCSQVSGGYILHFDRLESFSLATRRFGSGKTIEPSFISSFELVFSSLSGAYGSTFSLSRAFSFFQKTLCFTLT